MKMTIGTYTIPREVVTINEHLESLSPLDGEVIDYLEIVIDGENLKSSVINENILYPAGLIKCYDENNVEKDDFSEYNKKLMIKKTMDSKGESRIVLYMCKA